MVRNGKLVKQTCQPIDDKKMKIAQDWMQQASINCIVKDRRPIRFSECDGVQEMISKAIDIGVMLRRRPSDEELARIIPSRGVNKREIMKDAKEAKERLYAHLSKLDREPLPAIHTQFDFWEDKAKRRHYMLVLGQQACYETKSIKTYALDFF